MLRASYTVTLGNQSVGWWTEYDFYITVCTTCVLYVYMKCSHILKLGNNGICKFLLSIFYKKRNCILSHQSQVVEGFMFILDLIFSKVHSTGNLLRFCLFNAGQRGTFRSGFAQLCIEYGIQVEIYLHLK